MQRLQSVAASYEEEATAARAALSSSGDRTADILDENSALRAVSVFGSLKLRHCILTLVVHVATTVYPAVGFRANARGQEGDGSCIH